MKNMASVSGLLFGVLALSSCATLDKDECMTADWYSIGFEDGSKGRAENYLAEHRKACAKHGVTPDFNQYSQGHNRGTDSFCTPDRALRMAADAAQSPCVLAGGIRAPFIQSVRMRRNCRVRGPCCCEPVG